MKKSFLFIAAGLLFISLTISNAFATVSADGYLTYAGMSGEAAVVAMNSSTWGSVDRWFVLDPTTANALLATALSALTAGKNVSIGINSYDPGSIVTWLYIKSN